MAVEWNAVLEGRVRFNGHYAAQKLSFFDRYLPPAFLATSRKVTRHYVDLFAGPGVWQDEFGKRHPGSPLHVLKISAEARTTGFTEVFFVNNDAEDHQALARRVDQMVAGGLTALSRERIHLLYEDANDAIPQVLGRIHRKSWVLAYADIERPAQWPWESVEALRAAGHESLDLYLLFPLHMALRRILGYAVRHPDAVTRFYGSDEWKEIASRRKTSAQQRTFLREMEAHYAERLQEAGWEFVKRQRRVAQVGERILYYMLFATTHPVAKALSDWEAVTGGDERHRGQGELEL